MRSEVENGDKCFLSYDGTATMNGPVPMHLEGSWHFTGGTGKLAGLKGSGTCKARTTANGCMAVVIEGVYTISRSCRSNAAPNQRDLQTVGRAADAEDQP